MKTNKKLVVSNWKQYIKSPAGAEEILDFVNDYLESVGEKKEFSLVFCPGSDLLPRVSEMLKESHLEHESFLGAQDMSAEVLKSGAQYVIIGHSDRRYKAGDSDEIINKKLKSALENELIPIVCIGEKVRDENFKDFLRQQTEATFEGLTADEIARCIIAYEPVWAISTSPDARPDTPESALESISVIKEVLFRNYKLETSNYFLYGGSVTSANVADFLNHSVISGVLIGKASTNKEEFVKILKIAGGI